MDEGNPYKAPSFPAVSGIAAFRHRDWCSWLALALACIVPGLILWDVASRWVPLPRLPMGDLAFNIVFTVVVFLLTMVSVPFGFIGLRSRWSTIAAIATVLGIVNTAIVFYIKFYPVL
jgi:hypothetical protein